MLMGFIVYNWQIWGWYLINWTHLRYPVSYAVLGGAGPFGKWIQIIYIYVYIWNNMKVSINGGALISSILDWDFHYKPSSYGGSTIYGNPHMGWNLHRLYHIYNGIYKAYAYIYIIYTYIYMVYNPHDLTNPLSGRLHVAPLSSET